MLPPKVGEKNYPNLSFVAHTAAAKNNRNNSPETLFIIRGLDD
jgi:hypothetical protein